MPFNIAEQIPAFEAKRAALIAANTAIMEKAGEAGATLDAQQQEDFDTNSADVVSIDAHLTRLRSQEKAMQASAKAVDGHDSKSGGESRSVQSIIVKGTNLPKGTAFTRYAMALARSKGNTMQAMEIAKGWADSTPEVETVLKAAVAAGTTTDPAWAAPLVEYQNMASEFAELLRPKTIIGRIPGLRRVPFNIKVPRQTSGSTAQWVGEGKSKPVGKLGFDQITLGMLKVAGIVVLSDELVRVSSPSAEEIVRNDLAATIVERVDNDFIDPTKAAVAGISPASITNGATAIPSSGPTADDARADFKALIAEFLGNNMSSAGAVWIMSEVDALQLAMLTNIMGQPEFPSMQVSNTGTGTLLGLPVVASENVAAGNIILAKATEILLADDGQVVIDVSREASLMMDDAPTTPGTGFTSLWQQNLVGIRAERFINWTTRRPDAVVYITGADYTGIAPVVP